jgi:hypothetical protein
MNSILKSLSTDRFEAARIVSSGRKESAGTQLMIDRSTSQKCGPSKLFLLSMRARSIGVASSGLSQLEYPGKQAIALLWDRHPIGGHVA